MRDTLKGAIVPKCRTEAEEAVPPPAPWGLNSGVRPQRLRWAAGPHRDAPWRPWPGSGVLGCVESEFLDLARDGVAPDAQALRRLHPPSVGGGQRGADQA